MLSSQSLLNCLKSCITYRSNRYLQIWSLLVNLHAISQSAFMCSCQNSTVQEHTVSTSFNSMLHQFFPLRDPWDTLSMAMGNVHQIAFNGCYPSICNYAVVTVTPPGSSSVVHSWWRPFRSPLVPTYCKGHVGRCHTLHFLQICSLDSRSPAESAVVWTSFFISWDVQWHHFWPLQCHRKICPVWEVQFHAMLWPFKLKLCMLYESG